MRVMPICMAMLLGCSPKDQATQPPADLGTSPDLSTAPADLSLLPDGDLASPSPAPVQLKGAIQKGPFVVGSMVQVSLIDPATANPTGAIFSSTTRDNLGQFSLTLPSPGAAEILTEGFYFNEITGALSAAPITLRALVKLDSGNQTAYVNALTQLSELRAKSLIGSGTAFDAAILKAEGEARAQLGLPIPVSTAAGTALNVLGPDDDNNAYLLALSCALGRAAFDQAPGSVDAKLQEIIGTAALSLESGTLDVSVAASLQKAIKGLDPLRCADNLQAHLSLTGSTTVLPNILKAVDYDSDGKADFYDDDADGDGVAAADDKMMFVSASGAASNFLSYAIDSSGQLWSWSQYPPDRPQANAVKLPAIKRVVTLGSNLALASDGTVLRLSFTGAPTTIAGLSHVVQLAPAGYSTANAVKDDGTVWLIQGDNSVAQVAGLSSVAAAAGGDPNAPSGGQAVLASDGSLQVSLMDETLQQVSGLGSVQAIAGVALSSGWTSHYYALTSGGTLFALEASSTPMMVTTRQIASGVARVASDGSFFIKSDGTVSAFDYNTNVFTQVPGLSQVVDFSNGSDYWVAAFADGSVQRSSFQPQNLAGDAGVVTRAGAAIGVYIPR